MGIEEQYEEVRQLIAVGKEKGYLVYDEIHDVLPNEVTSSQDLDEIFRIFGNLGIEVLDSGEAARRKEKVKASSRDDDNKFDIQGRELEKTNDPVRMYLREMGTVPLLTREGEVEIARRIERGERNVLKALSRSRFATQRILDLGDLLRRRERRLEEIIKVPDETSEKGRAKLRLQTLNRINRVKRLDAELAKHQAHLRRLKEGSSRYREIATLANRKTVKIAQLIREMNMQDPSIFLLAREVKEGAEPFSRL